MQSRQVFVSSAICTCVFVCTYAWCSCTRMYIRTYVFSCVPTMIMHIWCMYCMYVCASDMCLIVCSHIPLSSTDLVCTDRHVSSHCHLSMVYRQSSVAATKHCLMSTFHRYCIYDSHDFKRNNFVHNVRCTMQLHQWSLFLFHRWLDLIVCSRCSI